MTKIEPWLSLIFTMISAGLIAYQSAVVTGANTRSATITGVIAALAAGQGHFRSGPLDAPAAQPTPKP